MRDISKPYRLAVFTALSGNVTVPVYDEKRLISATDTTFVLLSTQQQTPQEENDCTWISRASIDIEVTQKTGSEVSKDDIDDISNLICGILITAPFYTTLTSTNLQFQNAFIESIISRNLSISETESVLIKIIRFVCTVTEQN